jgi:hypothetical protein
VRVVQPAVEACTGGEKQSTTRISYVNNDDDLCPFSNQVDSIVALVL